MAEFNNGRFLNVSYDMESMNFFLLGYVKVHLCILHFEWIFYSYIDYLEKIVYWFMQIFQLLNLSLYNNFLKTCIH